MNPSNVMFTNGFLDPWYTLSIQSEYKALGAPNRTTTQIIPQCNQPPDRNEVFGLIYENGYHVSDFLSSENAGKAVELFGKALETWLPCFAPSEVAKRMAKN